MADGEARDDGEDGPRRPGDHRSPDGRERDRAEVARRYCQGQRQHEIAAVLGCSQQQVSYDLEVVRRRWRESALRDFDTALAEQLAKLDRVEAAAWDDWERSRAEPDEPGDPRFLLVALQCVERRCRLLGLDAQPDAPANSPAPITVVVAGRADVERLPRVEELLRAALPPPP